MERKCQTEIEEGAELLVTSFPLSRETGRHGVWSSLSKRLRRRAKRGMLAVGAAGCCETSAEMKAKPQFPENILAGLRDNTSLRIRAGSGPHRFIGIWVVVVRERVFIRSWSVKPNGWYRAFLKEPRGSIQAGDQEIAVRAVFIRNKSLRDAIDRAYLEKYNTPGALKYAKDLGSPKSRATTVELVPLSKGVEATVRMRNARGR
jgi:hypothetical protein